MRSTPRARPLVLALFLLLAGSAAAAADQFIPHGDGWQTYANSRYGIRLDFPGDLFRPEAAPENGDGRVFDAANATLQVHAFHNIEGDTPRSLKRRTVGSEGYEDVTYQASGGSWLVLSGYRGDMIFYEKFAFRDGVISAFGIEFPRDQKPFYSPIVERIEDSFHAGRAN